MYVITEEKYVCYKQKKIVIIIIIRHIIYANMTLNMI